MAHKITNAAGEVMTGAKVLSGYFGRQEGQSISGFMQEIKALKPADKEELVIGAAKEMGLTVTVEA